MSDTEIIRPLLGFRPYLLIELKDAEFDGDDADSDLLEVTADMRFGGGVTEDAIRELLEMVLDGLPEDEEQPA